MWHIDKSLAWKFLWQIWKQTSWMKNSWQRKDEWTDLKWVGKQQEQIQEECFKDKARHRMTPLCWKFQWIVMLMVQPYRIFYFLNLHRLLHSKKQLSSFFEAVTFNLLVVKDSIVITLSFQSDILRFSISLHLVVKVWHVIFISPSQLLSM